MSNSLRVLLILVSAAIFAAAYWWHFSTSAELWKVNREIERSWGKRKSSNETTIEQPEKRVTESASRMRSSGRDPIVLEGRGNYVTGKDVTFVVPSNMRRIQLTIQDRVGRRITSYTLPNTFIGIRANQRINLKVVE